MRTCLVLGGAACVWDDLEAALQLGEYAGVGGCNHIGIAYPEVMDFWVTLHVEPLRAWKAARERRGYLPHKRVITGDDTPYQFPGQPSNGSSGLFALKVALVDMGFDRAVLCGIPLSAVGHFFYKSSWAEAAAYWPALEEALPHIRDRARSMSGHTREVLGAPTTEWILGPPWLRDGLSHEGKTSHENDLQSDSAPHDEGSHLPESTLL